VARILTLEAVVEAGLVRSSEQSRCFETAGCLCKSSAAARKQLIYAYMRHRTKVSYAAASQALMQTRHLDTLKICAPQAIKSGG